MLANTISLYDIVDNTHRKLLSNNCAVKVFSGITKYCTIEHYSSPEYRVIKRTYLYFSFATTGNSFGSGANQELYRSQTLCFYVSKPSP